MAGAAFTAVLTFPITQEGTPPALEGAQGNADFAAGPHQAGARSIRLADQIDRLLPVGGAG
ncbi:hypothetical protein [Cyanobium sp. ULC084]